MAYFSSCQAGDPTSALAQQSSLSGISRIELESMGSASVACAPPSFASDELLNFRKCEQLT